MPIWILLVFAAWLAATVSGLAGFGGAMLLLPALTFGVGAKAAVPVLTIAQLLGNSSRAGFGFKEIAWRPVAFFSCGAIPACVVGSRLFVSLPSLLITRGIGVFLLFLVALRHTPFKRFSLPQPVLVPIGAVAGFLSAVAGSAGPLAAATFLSLRLSPTAYVASEAVTAVLMHLTKTAVYGRYALINGEALLVGIGAWRRDDPGIVDRAHSQSKTPRTSIPAFRRWPVDRLLAFAHHRLSQNVPAKASGFGSHVC